MPSSLDIVLGASWKEDARCLATLCAYRPGQDPFDFTGVRDIIDIVIDGTNITSKLPEDSIFHVIHELVHGLTMIREGHVHKHIIAFHESPWELAIQSSGDRLELSLYGVGRARQVAAHNLSVRQTAFIDSVCFAAEKLAADILELNSDLSRDATFRALTKRAARLRQAGQHPLSLRDAESIPDHIGRIAIESGERPLLLKLDLDARHADFWNYQGAHHADMHSLLFRGSLSVSYWGRTRQVAVSAYLFPLLSGLVAGAERMMTALERGAARTVLLDRSDGASAILTTKIEASGDFEHSDRLQLSIREQSGTVGQTWLTPERVFETSLGLVEQALDQMILLNPRQSLNGCITDLRSKIDEVRAQFQSLRRGDVFFEEVESYLDGLPSIADAAASMSEQASMPIELDRVRHLFLRSSWLLVRKQLSFHSIVPIDGGLLVPSRSRIDAISALDGKPFWERKGGSLLGNSSSEILTCAGTVLTCDDIGQDTSWSIELNSDPSEARLLTDGSNRTAVLTVGERTIVAVDMTTGEIRWRQELEHGEIVGTTLAGPVLAIVTNDGFATGLCATRGNELWKVRTQGLCSTPPMSADGRLFVAVDSDPGYGSMLYALDPLSGRMLYTTAVPASFVGRPLLTQKVGLFPLEYSGGAMVLAVDLETGIQLWSYRVQSAQIDAPCLAWPSASSRIPIVVKTDTGRCTGLDLCSGESVWTTDLLQPGDVLISNIEPVAVDGHLVVAEHAVSVLNPMSGERLFRFDGLPEHPSFLHAGDSLKLLIGEGQDHLECFDMRGFLALM